MSTESSSTSPLDEVFTLQNQKNKNCVSIFLKKAPSVSGSCRDDFKELIWFFTFFTSGFNNIFYISSKPNVSQLIATASHSYEIDSLLVSTFSVLPIGIRVVSSCLLIMYIETTHVEFLCNLSTDSKEKLQTVVELKVLFDRIILISLKWRNNQNSGTVVILKYDYSNFFYTKYLFPPGRYSPDMWKWLQNNNVLTSFALNKRLYSLQSFTEWNYSAIPLRKYIQKIQRLVSHSLHLNILWVLFVSLVDGYYAVYCRQ